MGDQIVNELIQTLPALLNELGVKVAKKLLSGQSQIGVRKQFLHLKKTQTEKKKTYKSALASLSLLFYIKAINNNNNIHTKPQPQRKSTTEQTIDSSAAQVLNRKDI